MKIVVLGAAGQLGRAIQDVAIELGIEIIPFTHHQLDILNFDDTICTLRKAAPDTIINCAAYSAVDKGETEPHKCKAINVEGARNVAISSEEIGSSLVYISTDYVFDGKQSVPYLEDDLPNPLQIYGKTKWLGEQASMQACSKLWVVRTSWLYGPYGNNFLYAILKNATNKAYLTVVNDQNGSPTNIYDLAHGLFALIQSTPYGIYNISGVDCCSWYDFAEAIIAEYGLECQIESCKTEEYKALAKRPPYSYLDNAQYRYYVKKDIPFWRDSLRSFAKKYSIEEILSSSKR